MPSPQRTLSPALVFLLSAASLLFPAHAQTQKSGQRADASLDPATLPARDAHQGLLIAVRADATAESSKAKFGARSPYGAGVLGLDVYFRNDNDLPVRINLDTVELFIGAPGEKQQGLDQLSHQDVAYLILSGSVKDPSAQRRIPVPIPTLGLNGGRDKNWQKLDDQLSSAALPGNIVPPHSTAHGYFYFDIDHQFAWLSNARLDVPDVTFAGGNHAALLFFEIDLASAAPR